MGGKVPFVTISQMSSAVRPKVGCSMAERRVVLPCEPTSARAGRDFLASASCTRHMAAVLDDAQLMISELIGNAIRHGLPPIEVAVRCVGTATLEVKVRDTGPAVPTTDHVEPERLDAEGGRGLFLVDLLASTWGIEPEPEGKTVWFRLSP